MKTMRMQTYRSRILWAAILLAGGAIGLGAAQSANPFVGSWALTLPGGGAGWLEIAQEKSYYDGRILWGGGSVVPVSSVFFSDDQDVVHVVRISEVKRRDAAGQVVRTHQFPELLMGRVDGDDLRLMRFRPRDNGEGIPQEELSGRRIPPLPPRPVLARVQYGEPIRLFNGRNLDGWRLTEPRQVNGWRVEDGTLVNEPVQQEGKPHRSYGNLRTEQEFEDFTLALEVRVPPKGNSGVYLRGIYEVQVSDSFGQGLDSHNMGAVYSRITPAVSAEKPAGQWQTMEITLLDRHVTVVLNGRKIIDNEPLLGCTGGALWSDQFRPGPIYLQGDHTGVAYRNVVLKPIRK